MFTGRLDRPAGFALLFTGIGTFIGIAMVVGGAFQAVSGPIERAGGITLFGGLIAAAAGIPLWRLFSERRRVERVAREGLELDAEILKARALGSPYKSVTSWRVRYRYVDPLGGVHEAETFDGPGDEARRWKKGQHVRIRIDRDDFASCAWLGVRSGTPTKVPGNPGKSGK